MAIFNQSLIGTYFPKVHSSVFGQLNVVTVRPVSNKITYRFKPSYALSTQTKSVTTIIINLTPIFLDGDYIEIDSFKFYFKTNPNFGEILIDNANQDVMSYNLYNLISNHPALSAIYNFNFYPQIGSVTQAAQINLESKIVAASRASVNFNGDNIYTPPTIFKLQNSNGNNGNGFNFFSNKANWGAFIKIYINTNFNTNINAIDYFKFPHDYFLVNRAPNLSDYVTVTLQKYLYNANEIEFDISGVLKEYVKPTSPMFSSILRNTRRCPNHIVAFGVEYGEFYNINNTTQINVSDSRAVYSPIDTSINVSANPNDLVSSFATVGSLETIKDQTYIDNVWPTYWKRDDIDDYVQYLAQPLFEKTTHPAAREFMYFFLYNDNTFNYLTAEYIINFGDGTTITYYEPKTTLFLSQNEGGVYCVEISAIDFLSIELLYNTEIDNYSVGIIVHDIANTYTNNKLRVAHRSYRFTCNRCKPIWSQLVYLNKLGGYDTIWCDGYQTKTLKIDPFSYDRFIDFSYDEDKRADSQQFSNTTRAQYEINCGLFRREEYNFYEDLFVSNDIYCQIDSSDFFKCKIITSNFTSNNLEDYIFLNLTIEKLYNTNNISNNQ